MHNSDSGIDAPLMINCSAQEPGGSSRATERSVIGTVLAFDFGKKRIGVALGEWGLQFARPLITIDCVMTKQRFEAIAKLIDAWQPVLLVVGLPTHADGTEHELTRLSRQFARRLEAHFGIKVFMVDERYTTISARSTLGELGIKGKKQRPMLDQIAAQHILQSFFDGDYAVT